MVSLRLISAEDSARIISWLADEEIRSLNPGVGHNLINFEFAIYAGDTHIGYCNVHNMDSYSAEIGITIGRKDYWNKGYGSDAVKQLIELCFEKLGIKLVRLKVLSTNIRALRCYEKCGFTRCGTATIDGYSFILMELTR